MLQLRIENLLLLKQYILQNNEEWQQVKLNAERHNGWFTQEFIAHSLQNICDAYLDKNELEKYANDMKLVDTTSIQRIVGITMAGNIPLVGFHDFLSVYLSGHIQHIKLSSKDDILLPHLIKKMYEIDEQNISKIIIATMLKNCDAYIATGSNNSALYFEKYFAKFPHIIRKNRTSVAILTGEETDEDLLNLADDVYLYFGLGCRNVSKIFVPENYQFEKLLHIFNKYDALKNHHKYRNNYDYNLAIFILNNQFYMSNESILLSENKSNYAAISVLNFEYYRDKPSIPNPSEIQAIVGKGYIPFGKAQNPSIIDYADGISMIDFINSL